MKNPFRQYRQKDNAISMDRSNFGVDLADDVQEFFKVNDSVSILIGIVDHLIDFGS